MLRKEWSTLIVNAHFGHFKLRTLSPFPHPIYSTGECVTQPSTIIDLGHTVEVISKSCFQTTSESELGADHVKTPVCEPTRGEVLARQVRYSYSTLVAIIKCVSCGVKWVHIHWSMWQYYLLFMHVSHQPTAFLFMFDGVMPSRRHHCHVANVALPSHTNPVIYM